MHAKSEAQKNRAGLPMTTPSQPGAANGKTNDLNNNLNIDNDMQDVDMKESTLQKTNDRDEARICADQFVLIHMPSGNIKKIELKPSTVVSLGKFGSFNSDALINQRFDVWYEIDKDKIRQIPNWELHDVEDTGANNQLINDNVNTQKLTHDEVEELKKEAHEGNIKAQEIIERMIESHSEFEKKTEYSKAKYIRRKQKKHSHRFKPVRPTVLTISQFFFGKNPEKINGLRFDTLSQLLSMACIRPKSKLLVVDDTQGMIVGAIADRLGGFGSIVGLHEGLGHNYDILRYMNFSEATLDTIYPLALATAESNDDPPRPDNSEFPKKKQLARYERRLRARRLYQEGDFDGLIISSKFTPESVIQRLLPKISGSRPIVVYSMNKETLLAAATYMRRSGSFINTEISESFIRQYQVLPGRTHPQMSMSGGGGYLLTALRVIDTPNPGLEGNSSTLKKKAKTAE